MILDKIVADKREELKALKRSVSEASLRERISGLAGTRGFKAALSEPCTRIIAEVKKASPSKGIIREDFDPVEIATLYGANGAAAISVLTEEKYFLGSLDYLTKIREQVGLPLLRKDFLFDEYQLFEARAAGADALLLIVAILEDALLKDLYQAACGMGMDVLVEVHNEPELERAMKTGAGIIGINNRDLKTFKTDIETTRRLAFLVPEGNVVVSESGINTRADIESLEGEGVNVFLIGEALVREADIPKSLRGLLGRD